MVSVKGKLYKDAQLLEIMGIVLNVTQDFIMTIISAQSYNKRKNFNSVKNIYSLINV